MTCKRTLKGDPLWPNVLFPDIDRPTVEAEGDAVFQRLHQTIMVISGFPNSQENRFGTAKTKGTARLMRLPDCRKIRGRLLFAKQL